MLTRRNHLRSWHLGKRTLVTALLLVAALTWSGAAWAQLPIPPSTQFDITGFLEEATLDLLPVPALGVAHQGGHLKVNGHLVTVPAETIVIFPANALTWQEIFVHAPAPWGIPGSVGVTAVNNGVIAPTTGMAAADCANALSAGICTSPPLTTYEVHVIGNRVLGATDQYIAGLIYVSQQGLNIGSGFINFIDLAKGEMRVGGVLNNSTTGARVRLNDPVGRYGLSTTSPDVRFTVDPDNPTITAATGFPMCLPRAAGDLACPQTNRPVAVAPAVGFASVIQMPNPTAVVAGGLDPRIQAPFEVGDWVTFAGTLVKDAPAAGFLSGDGPTVGTWPAPTGTDKTYISAHTISSNVAIYTWPGTNPAYVITDVTLIGTGGLTVIGAGEAVIRTRFEGMTTDVANPALSAAPQRNIHLYGIDLDPTSGLPTDRTWGTIGVDPGPPNGAVKGRWRFRPPCAPFGTVPAKPDKQCVMNQAGTFLPPTREMRAVIEGAWTPTGPQTLYANGILAGQYHAPISDYIFPENVPGAPIVENNFNTLPFLACGGYSSSGIDVVPFAPTLVGVLNPWPSNITPLACAGAVPVANIVATPNPAQSGATVTLSGTTSAGTPILTFLWTAPTGIVLLANGVPNNTSAVVTFTAPTVTVSTPLTFSLVVTDGNGVSSVPATVTVTVNPVVASDTVNIQSVVYRIAKQRLIVTATSTAGALATLTLQPYVATDGTIQQGGPLTTVNGITSITLVGVKQPVCGNATNTTPCPVGNAVQVTSSLGGSAVSPVTSIRQ